MGIPIIEFLRDRIYLGAFDVVPSPVSSQGRNRVFFTIDDLPYPAFNHDFGPLSIAHLYRFAVTLHEVLNRDENKGKAVVFYSGTDPRLRSNAACVLCSYMVLVQSWPPHLALAPIAQAQPPLMPFRDAGYSIADFVLTVQDVVYGVWRAKENGLINIRSFSLEEYEHYEMVEHGDLNEISPHFVAFASPVQETAGRVDSPFRSVLDYFKSHEVKLVVRLNSHLYDKSEFENEGIRHIDLIFDDGTCPSMTFVQGFIGAVEGVISEGGKVAVHCRAGLGRTGCLIGAHLIYTYGFTAQEAISYMRFLRPGMVVGPQQHWLYLHQNEFRDWRRTMRLSLIADDSLAGYCPLVPATWRDAGNARSSSGALRSPSGKIQPRTPERSILGQVGNAHSALPVPTPGQPRKSPSPIPVRSHSTIATKYHSIHNGTAEAETNSDEDISAAEITEAEASADETENGVNLKVNRIRTVSRQHQPPSGSRSPSGRRSVTEFAQQQRNMSRQTRGVSNGSVPPQGLRTLQRRRQTSSSSSASTASDGSTGTTAPVSFLRRPARVASVHK